MFGRMLAKKLIFNVEAACPGRPRLRRQRNDHRAISLPLWMTYAGIGRRCRRIHLSSERLGWLRAVYTYICIDKICW